MNLVSNPIKYRATRPLAISIHTETTSRGLRLTCSDNGMGIDLAKNGGSLFKPFRRFTTTSEGKGIGLYIIKTMVENNGGSVQFKAKPAKGPLLF